MGSDLHHPEEAPAHDVLVDGFWIDRHLVTNRQFARFVEATGYVTLAERAEDAGIARLAALAADPATLQVFGWPPPADRRGGPPGATWRYPRGPGSSAERLSSHPTVHVAWEDAEAYAAWARKALPTEAEWELAARGGLRGKVYAWGDELAPEGRRMANVWWGELPPELTLDGCDGTSPVGCFPPNGYGLYDMIGNVWEWTADPWDRGTAPAPPCSDGGAEADPAGLNDRRVLKGGSYLCAPGYCARYRPAARVPQQVRTGAAHVGFRCVVRVSRDH